MKLWSRGNEKYSRQDRKYIETRLERWGDWVSKSVNCGWNSRNPIVDMIEYHTKPSGSGFNAIDSFGPYDRDQYNSLTNTAVRELSNTQYKMCFLEYAWHHIDLGETVYLDKYKIRIPHNRRKLRGKQVAAMCDMSKSTFHRYKNQYLIEILDFIRDFKGLKGVNIPE